ncbi:ABC transporter permease [Streptomyces sp. A7024]|uniref:ABC transporter permease n=1 Tax=Streptomyces coryli TaxID=1128680 RepID=A0A6G4U6E2_9ACTN|nr:FtsX-like permease family protein [Streptomyces coryli]NGN66958.1 ABC transporter permease [Streptomyces coryli]
MGLAFAFRGGKEGWTRTLLTAVGVGLGVALLLLTTAIPAALQARDQRGNDRSDLQPQQLKHATATSILVGNGDTTFGDDDIHGRLVRPEGAKATPPPGLDRYPRPGEMAVSPALADRLNDKDAGLLRDRLPYKITATIGDAGLAGGPAELAYYAGSDDLRYGTDSVHRIGGFGHDAVPGSLDPVLLLLVLIVFVALLMPVAVFVAAAVRFGGERRDRRLAALRLVGADAAMTRRIAAGEAAAGALLGLVFGTGFFLVGRQVAGGLTVLNVSVFPADLNPAPWLAALVAVAVPAAAVAVTLFALRNVVIEPLGVVRTAKPKRRRLWWRVLLPLAGLAALFPLIGKGDDGGDFNAYQVTTGVVLLLTGITALLPWLVEAVVARLGRGNRAPVSWQLAVRRLQLNSGSAARLVNGIAVAVAGAVALQMLFTGVEDDYTRQTGQDTEQAQMWVRASGAGGAHLDERLADTEGVRGTITLNRVSIALKARTEKSTTLTVGTCKALREVANLPSCTDGDIFYISGGYSDKYTKRITAPGSRVYLDPSYEFDKGKAVPWQMPRGARTATKKHAPNDMAREGVLATPAAARAPLASGTITAEAYVRTDPAVSDAADQVRTAAAAVDPLTTVMTLNSTEESNQFAGIRTGLLVGAVCVLLLIGASLLVGQLEQLRERRKLLSSLVAFGTKRSTLSLSVLWQTAIPVALGLTLATGTGVALGAVLLKMAATPVTVDWPAILTMAAAGGAVVAAVTLLSLPPLIRMMRAEGLRTE